MNDGLLITLIIYATVIAIVAIVFSFFSQRKANTNMEVFLNQRNVKLHRNYIVGFLCAAVILLATSKCVGNGNEIFSYISFASTITSIVLSILAIFVTVQSSADINRQFAKIEDATNAVSNASQTLTQTLEKILDVENDLRKTSGKLGEQTEKIADDIHVRVSKCMHETEERLSSKIELSNKHFPENVLREATGNAIQSWITGWCDGFLNSASIVGLFSIYACCLSVENQKPFTLDEIFGGNSLYTYGFLMSAASAGVINISIDGDGRATVSYAYWESKQVFEKITPRLNGMKNQEDAQGLQRKIEKFFCEK